ncbi:MAG: S8 family serine peptidase, partial [Sphingomonadaceae bacterium]
MHKARWSPAIVPLMVGPMLAACGGGGGGSGPAPVTPSAVAPPPAVTPPAPSPVSPFDTAEYRRSSAAVQAGVLSAWDRGADGRGVTMGFVDSGIDATSPEFAGRIHPASRDVTGQGRGIQDVSGHGTSTVAVAAAARNDSGIVGVAPAATLAILRADNGQCTPGCSYNDPAIAAGVDAAVAAGARVISLSLGGGAPTSPLRNAFARATAAGTVLVLSAGNESLPEIGGFPAGALSAGGSALVIVAGAIDQNRQITDFTNRAGAAQNNFIAAPGLELRSFNHTGTAVLASGTSYSAPIVAAAIALLAQAWPELPASRLVQILLESADDAGAPGVDPVYGRGILNIGRAFQPAGPTMLAGSTVVVPLGANGSAGPVFGDSLRAGAGLSAVPVLDRFGRDYVVPLRRSLPLPSTEQLADIRGGAAGVR